MIIFIVIGILSCTLVGCGSDTDPSNAARVGQQEDLLTTPLGCSVTAARYPTVPGEMSQVYANRSFYADGNHLGHDVALSEGEAIHPIACGTLRVYRSASGYGELIAVIEHKLETPLIVLNGMGEQVTVDSFLSIYGHIRKSANRSGTDGLLGHMPGDTIGPDDVIGYVNDDAHNGDGNVHLHLGIRLQSAVDAQATDSAWFRGYDGSPSQRRWFADPVLFLATLTSTVMPVFWHPPGTVIRRPSDGSIWVVDHEIQRQPVDTETVSRERLMERAINVTDAELGCMNPVSSFVSPRAGRRVLKFDDASTVYEYLVGPDAIGVGAERRAFISYDAFRSWGWQDTDIRLLPSSDRDAFFWETTDRGFRMLRDGSLVKTNTSSEVSVVSEGRRLPIVDWPTFLALGYRSEDILTIPSDVIDVVAGPRGPLVTKDLVGYCVHPSACLENCPSPGDGGGGTEDPPVDDPPVEDPPEPPVSDIPVGMVRFRYEGPVTTGLHSFQGMWDPPGAVFHDWTAETSALCPDEDATDGVLECLLEAPSGTVNLLFTVQLPDGRWWGDLSCDATGGCGETIGTVTLESATGTIPYDLLPNGTGSTYMNGFVDAIP